MLVCAAVSSSTAARLGDVAAVPSPPLHFPVPPCPSPPPLPLPPPNLLCSRNPPPSLPPTPNPSNPSSASGFYTIYTSISIASCSKLNIA